ncbi:NHS-like protein 1 isoform X2 [Tigriopus californicus]|uniref:NHS-like protein 1 isoform X2 n=1 Tax=Tigriopus californicus TaxID=6832 RepID=UPI0027DA5517|nr:NHS-like protein 1 isoform X2 [Tigriopus californicus]
MQSEVGLPLPNSNGFPNLGISSSRLGCPLPPRPPTPKNGSIGSVSSRNCAGAPLPSQLQQNSASTMGQSEDANLRKLSQAADRVPIMSSGVVGVGSGQFDESQDSSEFPSSPSGHQDYENLSSSTRQAPSQRQKREVLPPTPPHPSQPVDSSRSHSMLSSTPNANVSGTTKSPRRKASDDGAHYSDLTPKHRSHHHHPHPHRHHQLRPSKSLGAPSRRPTSPSAQGSSSQPSEEGGSVAPTNGDIVKPQVTSVNGHDESNSIYQPSNMFNNYSDHLRSSSYVMMQQNHTNRKSGGIYHQPQSLPYMSASMLIEAPAKHSASPVRKHSDVFPKTPRTCELEEYARRYEASVMQKGQRRRPTPPSCSNEHQLHFWQSQQQRRHSVWTRVPSDDNYSNGRDSVMTNSSSETIKYQDNNENNRGFHPVSNHYHSSALYQNQESLSLNYSNHYSNMHQLKRSNQQSHYQNLINDYASLPPEPRAHRDLKKFPLQTYSSSKHLGSQEKGQDVSDSSSRPGLRHQVSERIISKSKSENKENTATDLHHSKSVPNLANNILQQPQHTNGSGDHSSGDIDHDLTSDPANFSYLDPEKRLRVTDNTLKLIQKQALLDYYERHNTLRRPGLASHLNGGKFPNSVNDLDSGFYSPTESKVNCETTLSNVAEVDHHVSPSQSQSDGSDTKYEEELAQYDDDDIDEELEKVISNLEAEENGSDSTDSARPVYLQEKAQAYRNGATLEEKREITPPTISGTLEVWRQRQESERDRIRRMELHPSPPERPPKKPHLRSSSSRDNTPPPTTPPRGHTPSHSSSSGSSRVTTPISYSRSSSIRHSKPKFPSPPGSPRSGAKARSPTPPPPPSPLPRMPSPPSIQDLPLPPPPPPSAEGLSHAVPSGLNLPPLPEQLLSPQNNSRICDSPKNKDSPLSPHHGMEGKYRRTSSPSICNAPNVKPSVNVNDNPGMGDNSLNHSPVRAPKRESPATIAAKGAPGWEKFLGGKTSTVQFTSEEVNKFKQHRDEQMAHQNQQPHPPRHLPPATPPKPPPKPKANQVLDDHPPTSAFHSPRGIKSSFKPQPRMVSPTNANIGLSPIHGSKSSPSLNQGSPNHTPTSANLHHPSSENHRSRGIKKRHHHNHHHHHHHNNVWKNSLESLRVPNNRSSETNGESPSRGFIAVSSPPQSRTPGANNTDLYHAGAPGVNHSHSNSDSGLSSLSGRTSTMSPISTMSTVSSVSSASSSGSSSRNSLRSASIVSSCTIPLDEEEEQLSNDSSPSGTMKTEYHQPLLSNSPMKPGNKRRPSLAWEKLPEEVECDELSREFLEQLPSNAAVHGKKLKTLFGAPHNAKTSADYIDGLFDFDLSENESQIHQRRFQKNLSPSMLKNRIEVLHNENKKSNAGSCSFSSIAESKARFLRDVTNANDFMQDKKELLLARICTKLDILKAEQVALKEETKLNEELGREITLQVMQLAQPNECDKYKLHLEEIDKISSLIFGLSGRLARAENALLALPTDTEDKEKEALASKRDKLTDQLSEAKKLKDNIDKRSKLVGDLLKKYLKESTLQDYGVYVKMKVKLIMESREVQEKIAIGEEQSVALQDVN